MANYPKVRLLDVAERAHVSRAAAAKVLNGINGSIRVSEETRYRIEKIAREMNYHSNISAAVLAGKHSDMYGVFIDSCAWFYHRRLLEELECLAAANNKCLMVSFTHENIDHIRKNYFVMRGFGADGIICISHDYPGLKKEIAELFAEDPNVVYLEKPSGIANATWVDTSYEDAMTNLFANAIASGKKKLALMCGSLIWNFNEKILNNYRQALKNNHLPYSPSLVMEFPDHEDFIVRAQKFIDLLIEPQRPDVVFCNDSADATAIQSCLFENGWKVRDFPVIYGGTNNSDFRCITPKIPSFDPQYRKIAEALLDALEHPGTPGCHRMIPARYIPGLEKVRGI